jgi:hypothetical protein
MSADSLLTLRNSPLMQTFRLRSSVPGAGIGRRLMPGIAPKATYASSGQ